MSKDEMVDVEAAVLRLLPEVIPWRFTRASIRPETSLQGELGMESLGKVALAFRLEREFGIDISQYSGTIADIRTVGDIIAAVRQLRSDSGRADGNT